MVNVPAALAASAISLQQVIPSSSVASLVETSVTSLGIDSATSFVATPAATDTVITVVTTGGGVSETESATSVVTLVTIPAPENVANVSTLLTSTVTDIAPATTAPGDPVETPVVDVNSAESKAASPTPTETVSNTSPPVLIQPRQAGNPVALTNSCEAQGQIGITIDEGPGLQTLNILEMLDQEGVKATFHIVTKYLNTQSIGLFVEEARRRGHVIGLRYNPPNGFDSMTDDEIIEALVEQSEAIAAIIGVHPRFIRLPHNSVDDRVRTVVESMGFIITAFNIDSQDYLADATPQSVRQTYANKFAPLGNILGRWISVHHDSANRDFLPESIRESIAEGKALGYNFVTLDRCLTRESGGAVYRSDAYGQAPYISNSNVPVFTGTETTSQSGGSPSGNGSSSGNSNAGFVPNPESSGAPGVTVSWAISLGTGVLLGVMAIFA